MISKKEQSLTNVLRKRLTGAPRAVAEWLLRDAEVKCLQDYANTVSIKRLGFNDHGPVHMRAVAVNALIMLQLLRDAGVQLSLEKEDIGSFDDSTAAILIAAMLHDIGMSIGRELHERNAVALARPIIDRMLDDVYGADLQRRVVIRSLALECMLGHMATQRVHSLEAGVVLIADGCDMERGRARIPMLLTTESKVGDIHKYSAAAIEKVVIDKGTARPIRITVSMTDMVGFYQIEEVLFKKIDRSTIKSHIELYAGVSAAAMKCYL
jgi:metal-dependent HD superfamily phosphatase/phosphodiesterase